MTAQHPAGRARRPLPRVDPRLVIGVILVVASVAGVVAMVTALDRSVTVFTARDTLIAGDVVTQHDLVQAEVRLGALVESYLTPDSLPADGVVIARTVDKGELVPLSATGGVGAFASASIVVQLADALPASITAGALVDVWAAPNGRADNAGVPSVIAPGAVVVAVLKDDSLVASRGASSVEILVPRDRIARLLEAKTAQDALSLVPASVTRAGGGDSGAASGAHDEGAE